MNRIGSDRVKLPITKKKNVFVSHTCDDKKKKKL